MGMNDQNEDRTRRTEAHEPASDAMDDTEEPEIVETSPADELEIERTRAAEYLDQAQRTRAELINYKRRVEQDMQTARQFAAERVIRNILPVIDDFHRAIAAVPDDERENPWVQGMLLIERKMWSVLEGEGVKPIEAVGTPFNTSMHEAVSGEDDGSGVVVEEFQRGFMLHDRVLRPSLVKVAPGKTSNPEMNA